MKSKYCNAVGFVTHKKQFANLAQPFPSHPAQALPRSTTSIAQWWATTEVWGSAGVG
jgi:hypothetical protein